MAPPTERKACGVCARILDWFEPAGEAEAGYWRHGLPDGGEEADHPAVPVDHADVATIYRCDFCHTDESAFFLPVHTFTAPTPEGTPEFRSDGDWSACAGCGRLIDLNQWTGLLRRVKKLWEQRNGPMSAQIETSLNRLYRQIRQNQKGSMVPFVPPVPKGGSPGVIDWGQNRANGPDNL